MIDVLSPTGVSGAGRGVVLVVVGRGGENAAGGFLRLVYSTAQHGSVRSDGREEGKDEEKEREEEEGEKRGKFKI